ncbi:MAG: DUF2189 domain-containing protein [Zoogloeaceae bacterium]|nr:DUF2189 domain-containing protein [Rhodocyclaceae bacterium]MCP5236524.1 DUF2189 domain-containing protein [Zoogloeaceae bacterium]
MTPPRPRPLPIAGIAAALADGRRTFAASRGFSLAFGALFAAIGSLMIWGAQWFALAPMTPALIGGFLLVGPIVMAALIGAAEDVAAGRRPSLTRVIGSMRRAPAGLWALALFCLLIYLIWITDAGTLYSFMIGEPRSGFVQALPTAAGNEHFHLFSGLMGFALANVVYAVTVHAVPLMVRRRTPLATAVVASVRACFASPLVHGAWALTLAAGIFVSMSLPPLLCVSLPILAYAGDSLNRRCFDSPP